MMGVELLGVEIDNVDIKGALKLIEGWLGEKEKHQIATVNPEFLVLANRDRGFKEILNTVSLAVADGVGLVLAARILKGSKLKRVTGVELMLSLVSLAAAKNLRVYLLGGDPSQIVVETTKKLRDKYPALLIQGSSGVANVSMETQTQREDIISAINGFKPHFLFVAYGAPWQDKWIFENLKQLEVKVAMGVGGTFDYISGKIRRAPKFVRFFGLEWLWRLGREPRYRWRRIVDAIIVFPWLVMSEKVRVQRSKIKDQKQVQS